MTALFLTFNIIIQESNYTDSTSIRNVKEITCGCDACTCIARRIPKNVQENCFSVLKKIGKVKSNWKHSNSYRNTKTQTLDKQVYCKEGNQYIRKLVMYLSGGGYFYLSKYIIHINIRVMLVLEIDEMLTQFVVFLYIWIHPCYLAYRWFYDNVSIVAASELMNLSQEWGS